MYFSVNCEPTRVMVTSQCYTALLIFFLLILGCSHWSSFFLYNLYQLVKQSTNQLVFNFYVAKKFIRFFFCRFFKTKRFTYASCTKNSRVFFTYLKRMNV
jgi:hypothetical protein